MIPASDAHQAQILAERRLVELVHNELNLRHGGWPGCACKDHVSTPLGVEARGPIPARILLCAARSGEIWVLIRGSRVDLSIQPTWKIRSSAAELLLKKYLGSDWLEVAPRFMRFTLDILAVLLRTFLYVRRIRF